MPQASATWPRTARSASSSCGGTRPDLLRARRSNVGRPTFGRVIGTAPLVRLAVERPPPYGTGFGRLGRLLMPVLTWAASPCWPRTFGAYVDYVVSGKDFVDRVAGSDRTPA